MLSKFQIMISETDNRTAATKCFQDVSASVPAPFSAPCEGRARYMWIELVKGAALELCEVQIFRRSCSDVNECLSITHGCDTNALCTNTQGSFQCQCNAGYFENGKTCSDVDECAALDPKACSGQNSVCINTVGSFDCMCESGLLMTT